MPGKKFLFKYSKKQHLSRVLQREVGKPSLFSSFKKLLVAQILLQASLPSSCFQAIAGNQVKAPVQTMKKNAPAKVSAGAKASDGAKTSAGKSGTVEKLLNEAAELEISGKKEEASAKAEKAISEAEKLNDTAGIIVSASTKADLLDLNDELQAQKTLRQKALDLALSHYGSKSPGYALALAKLSAYYARKGEVAKTRDAIEEAMSILGADQNRYPNEFAACFFARARRQISEGSFGLADDSFQKALQLEDSSPKKNKLLLFAILKEYSDLLEKLERKSEAEKLNDRLNLMKASAVPLETANASATASNTKKGLFAKLVSDARKASEAGDRNNAISTWKLALAEAEKSSGQDGARQSAFALLHLADEYKQLKQLQEAESLYKKSLSIREKAGLDKSLGAARNLKRLADSYSSEKKTQEAGSLLKKALEIEKQCKASDVVMAGTLTSLISVSMLNKDLKETEDSARLLLAISERQSGASAANNKRLAISMLGSVYMQSGRTNEGLSLMKQVADLMKAGSTEDYSNAYMSDYKEIEKEIDASELP